MNEVIFTIPIYRTDSETHYKDLGKKMRKLFADLDDEESKKAINLYLPTAEKKFWYKWKFNQVVGWLEIYLERYDILASLYWVTSKKIRMDQNRNYSWRSYKEIELSYKPGSDVSDERIFKDILEELEELKNEKPYKGRYMDLEPFKRTGKCIRWNELINSINNNDVGSI